MNKTMSDCCAFWALYICLNENGQYKKEEEAQNWLDWMEELAEKEDESQRTEQEPVADDFFKMIADRNPKFFPSPQRTWVGLTDEEIASVANNNHPLNGIRSYARAIEAKLKELNG